MTSFDLDWVFLVSELFLYNFCQNVPNFIPGAIFGKNVENYKISCSGNGNPAPKMKKNMKMMPIPVDFRMSRLFRFIPFYSAFILPWGHVRSRELSRYFWPYFTWLTSDWIFKMFNSCIFEKKSLKTKLKNYKTELNSLRRGLIRSRTFENTQHRSFLFRDLFQKF